MEPLKLHEEKHPQKTAKARFDRLIGLDYQKNLLLDNLAFLFGTKEVEGWRKRHHPKGLSLLDSTVRATPLILMSGDVGCGKTELASCIGTPLSERLDRAVRVFETPSDTRGTGMVGQLSARIASAFRQATAKVKSREVGILIIDEADDLATGRDQQQAHHEDRAGVNALIKEIDRIGKDDAAMAVILITNRSVVMDPAILRRTIVDIRFSRPDTSQLQLVLKYLTHQIEVSPEQLSALVKLCAGKKPNYSYSDLFVRVARQAIIRAQWQDKPFSADILLDTIKATEPSPTIEQS